MKKRFTLSKSKGFTLIELLVVIAIVGLLASIVMVGLNSARSKSRDTKRIAELKQMMSALELYYSDNGHYPAINYAYTSSAADGCGYSGRWCQLETALSPYIKPLPRDPAGSQDNYRYYYDSDSGDSNQTYGLMARMENSGNYPLAANDGGYYGSNGAYYEIGKQPSYCRSTYNQNWWSSGTTVCSSSN